MQDGLLEGAVFPSRAFDGSDLTSRDANEKLLFDSRGSQHSRQPGVDFIEI